MITVSRLREVLSYCPDTGEFRWKPRGRGVCPGKLAGRPIRTGYLRIGVDGTDYYSHRLAWLYVYGRWPKDQIDHINRDVADNRITNLRECTTQENHRNMPLARDNGSGVCGVYRTRSNTWAAQIGIGPKLLHLGTFKTKPEAAAARKEAERQYGFSPTHGKRNTQVSP